MSLAPGTRLAHYEIVAALGAGGMGEVFRARDTQLGRDVALKVLPESFAADPDRLMRFTREARTLASLNHPGIAAIYGIAESGPTRALVMELVEGEDLSQRIALGAMSIQDVLPIARQIAEALEAAHENGIIHRDLKPANIKVRTDGTVKVLDFGLAKAMEAHPAGTAEVTFSGMTNSPTMTSPAMTAMGLILGTAAYMSPEQARGRPVDKRADIWAFGVVLYEMLTGATLFAGETVSDVLAAVLRADIDLATLPASVPPGIRHLISRCLEKDPRRRLRDIGEARVWLEVPDGPASLSRSSPPVSAAETAASRAWPAVAAVAVVSTMALSAWVLWSPVPETPVIHASIQLPPGTEYLITEANPPNLAVSPDGSVIAFSATPIGSTVSSAKLYIRRLGDAHATEIPDSAGARVPFFSPDGRSVAFLAGSTFKRASLTGGAPSTITTGISNIWGSAWLTDGTIVFANPKPTGEMLYSVPENGGEAKVLSRVESLNNDNSFPQDLDNDHLLVTMWTGGLYTDAKIFKYSKKTLATTEQLVEGGSQAHMLSGRYLLYARGPQLMAQPYPGSQAGAVKLLDGVLTDTSYSTAQFDASPSGTLVYVPAPNQAPTASAVWVSPDGRIDSLFEDPRIEMVRLSADGRHLVFISTQATREKDLWTYDVMARRRSRLTTERGEEYSPVVSNDGQRVIFSAWRNKAGMYQTSLSGSGERQLVMPSDRAVRGWSISPDGRWLVVTDDVPGGAFDRAGADLGVMDLNAQTMTPRWLTTTASREDQPAWSPTDNLIAFTSNQLGVADVWIMAFSEGEMKPAIPVSRQGGMNPFWSHDGRTLYFLQGQTVMSTSVSRGESVTFTEPRKVFDLPNLTVVGVAPDGRFLAVQRNREPATRLDIVVNWVSEFKGRVR